MARFIPSMQTLLNLIPLIVPTSLYPWLRSFIIQSLKVGPLPQHVGFIMDGNRRFSRVRGVDVKKGHEEGLKALIRVLELLLRLQVPNVTVYAFAIENFKRSKCEVEKLMELARMKLVQLCEKGQILDRYGVRVFVIGRKELLPLDVREACLKVESMTAKNSKGCLNIAFPYSSQEEMTTALQRSINQTLHAGLPPSTISTELIESNLYTCHAPPLDILIRSSGVCRLSDFLLWQTTGFVVKTPTPLLTSSPNKQLKRPPIENENDATNGDGILLRHQRRFKNFSSSKKMTKSAQRRRSQGAAIHFVNRFWPDFGILDVVPILLGWQAEAIVDSLLDGLWVWWQGFMTQLLYWQFVFGQTTKHKYS